MMKVLLISPLPPPAGGIATWTEKYRGCAEKYGIDLTIVNNALRGDRAENRPAGTQLSVEWKRSRYVLRELDRYLREEKPDLVHLNSSCSRFGIFRDLMCVLLAEARKTPVVLHCHCNIPDQLVSGAGKLAFRILAGKAKKIITLNGCSNAYASQYGKEKTVTVPNFIEEQVLGGQETVCENIRSVVFLGHVRKSKGVGEIIRAAEQLPRMRFLLIGPVLEDVSRMPVTPNVELLGSKPHREALELLRQGDVFLFPSHTEGFANALTEAMASGLPVVTTDVGANREMIEESGGLTVPVGDSDAIVRALKKLDADPQLRREMSRWNVEKVRGNYLLDAVMPKLRQIYLEII